MSGSHIQRRIYLVDDEHLIVSTLARILCLRGFDATGFTEPLLALEAARSEAPDLLISDIVMPVVGDRPGDPSSGGLPRVPRDSVFGTGESG